MVVRTAAAAVVLVAGFPLAASPAAAAAQQSTCWLLSVKMHIHWCAFSFLLPPLRAAVGARCVATAAAEASIAVAKCTVFAGWRADCRMLWQLAVVSSLSSDAYTLQTASTHA